MHPRFIMLISFLFLLTSGAAAQALTNDEVFKYDEAHPAAGYWIGTLTTDQGNKLALIVSAEKKDEWEVKISALAGGLLDTPCSDIKEKGQEFSFTITGFPGTTPHFEGNISEDGQAFKGSVTDLKKEKPQPGSFLLRRTVKASDMANPLAFTGELNAQGITIPMTILLAKTPGGNWVGSLDIPMQNLHEFPFINISETEDGTITAELPVPGGADIEVKPDEMNKHLEGVFRQSGLVMKIDFTRDENYTYRNLVRLQTPQKPYPYREIPVTAPHPQGFSLGGTLTLPDPEKYGNGPYPAVVLISGSGQQDRDESILGHKPFLIIADYLTRHGIAVMRYDDRGVGDSEVKESKLVTEATTSDFATDTIAVINKLKTMKEIDSDHIGLIGHSEGGLIAPMVADRMGNNIDFIILLAGPGVKGDLLLVKQTELLLKAAGVSDESIKAQSEIRRKLFEAVEDDDEAIAKKYLKKLITKQLESTGRKVTDTEIQDALKTAEKQLLNPWMRYFLSYDPAPVLARVKCPVLALNGTRDLQVWHKQNLDAIERIRKQADLPVTVIRYEGLNHLFQPARTGTVSEYITIETTIDEQVLSDMTEWIRKQVSRKN